MPLPFNSSFLSLLICSITTVLSPVQKPAISTETSKNPPGLMPVLQNYPIRIFLQDRHYDFFKFIPGIGVKMRNFYVSDLPRLLRRGFLYLFHFPFNALNLNPITDDRIIFRLAKSFSENIQCNLGAFRSANFADRLVQINIRRILAVNL